jgi:hypothetical protein
MARIAGIKLYKTSTGKLKAVTVDLKKHGSMINPYLEKIGIIEAKEREEFEKKWKSGITGEEVKKRIIAHIDKVWKEKYGV